MAKKSFLDSISVPAPCDKKWNEMTGDEQKRFCSGCQKNVFNISAMPRREASRLITDKAGEICIRYTRLPNGQVMTTERKFHQISRRTSAMAAGVIAATLTFSAISPSQTETPGPAPISITQIAPRSHSQAKISTIITDPNGAVIQTVRILLKDIKRNTVTEGFSDDDGLYEFAGIKPSIYEIQITRDGFKPFVKSNIEFSGDKTLEIKIVLEGILIDEVGLYSPTETIESEPQKASANISTRPLEDLPRSEKVFFTGLILSNSKTKTKTGTISLTVYSENKELIPRARITLTNQKTKEVFSITASNDGEVQFSSMIYGKYLMTASSPGFAENRMIIKLNKKINPDLKIILKTIIYPQMGDFVIEDPAMVLKEKGAGKSQSGENKHRRKLISDTSQISFTIDDSAGAVIPAIQIKLTNQKTRAEFYASTDQNGVARFGLLPHGVYNLLVSSSAGFNPYQQTIQIKEAVEPNTKITLSAGTFVGVVVNNWSEIPLFQALAGNDTETVKQIINSGFDVRTKDNDKRTALHIAVEQGNLEIVQFLLERGAKVNVKDKNGLTPLLLIGSGSDADDKAAEKIFRLLLAKGADINARNEDHETLLMLACENNEFEAVKILLEAKADPNLKDADGKTALQKTDSDEIKRLLQSYGAH